MYLAGVQESQGVILLFAAIIILFIVVRTTIKFGIKSLIGWLIVGIIAYLLISDAIIR